MPQQRQPHFSDGKFNSRLRAGLDDVHSIPYNGPFDILGALERLLELDPSCTQSRAKLHMSQEVSVMLAIISNISVPVRREGSTI